MKSCKITPPHLALILINFKKASKNRKLVFARYYGHVEFDILILIYGNIL